MDFVFILILVAISFLIGFIYDSLIKLEQLKKQQKEKKELEKDQLLMISNLNHQIKKCELENKIHHNQLSIESKKQEIVDQNNKSEHDKLIKVRDDQTDEIYQLRSLINHQKQSLQSYGVNQGKLVKEKDSLNIKLDDQIRNSNKLQEQILEKNKIIQFLEKKIETEQQVLIQLSIEHNEALEKLNLKEGELETNNMNYREQDPFDREPLDMDQKSEISSIGEFSEISDFKDDNEHLDIEENNECTICYSKMKTMNVSYIGCDHKFCFDCILTWSQCCNTCPECKNRFNTITRETKVEGLINVADVCWKDQYHESYKEEEIIEDMVLYHDRSDPNIDDLMDIDSY
ncbi:hypothetical protein DICPUDRAFT_159265 [Dictyostelium purpureum]|uniref:RING-type domain-containing protein n=1 Tax=Dictyostelium purpureum TaxID=5786 RepID=F1A3P2_DICPU|nr:uncharacterized protein DICPUDRAFT_159265 [Dictyostelium purpureum]EGC29192.1 hypothetical protein DICPUDRAFT_159265 [Dictyostelium purpureum]|eukprot:XP_003294287.1 hypothetical protein DICPUDRAFT_159265 [Dictyostelium purpureum]